MFIHHFQSIIFTLANNINTLLIDKLTYLRTVDKNADFQVVRELVAEDIENNLKGEKQIF